jgi:hypothetical protein
MRGDAQPHFSMTFGENVRAIVGVERGRLRVTKPREILEYDLRKWSLERRPVGVSAFPEEPPGLVE